MSQSRSASRRRAAPRPHDWRAGQAGQRPHLRTLVRMHEVMLEQLTSTLSRQLRCDVDVELAATELATFDEYLRSMPLVTVVSTYKLSPLDGRCAVELNPQLATVMVERMLGGPGTLPQLRRLTGLEAAALTEVFDVVEAGIATAFAPVIQLHVRHDDLVYDPEFLDIAEGQETVVLLAYRIELKAEASTTEGIFTLCYPTSQMAPVLRQLQDAALVEVEQEPSQRPAGPLAEHLPDVTVPITVSLNPTQLLARDVADLAPGDVLRLDHRIDDPVSGTVGDSLLFEGHLGQRRRRLAVHLLGVRTPDPAGRADAPQALPASTGSTAPTVPTTPSAAPAATEEAP